MTRQCEMCGADLDNFAAYADGDLQEEERARVVACVGTCAACADELQAMTIVRQQLRAMGRRQSVPSPPSRVWAGALKAWELRDGRQLRRVQTRLAMVAACVLLLLFGVVWARLNVPNEFPVNVALRDYAQLRGRNHIPERPTSDPDQAASWLRGKLNADIPPIDLKLSRATLLGADTLVVGSRAIGRLLYRQPAGLVAVYIAPAATEFGDLPQRIFDGEPFRFASDGKADGLYGWWVGSTGFAVIVAKTPANGSLLIEAETNTRAPAR